MPVPTRSPWLTVAAGAPLGLRAPGREMAMTFARLADTVDAAAGRVTADADGCEIGTPPVTQSRAADRKHRAPADAAAAFSAARFRVAAGFVDPYAHGSGSTWHRHHLSGPLASRRSVPGGCGPLTVRVWTAGSNRVCRCAQLSDNTAVQRPQPGSTTCQAPGEPVQGEGRAGRAVGGGGPYRGGTGDLTRRDRDGSASWVTLGGWGAVGGLFERVMLTWGHASRRGRH